MKIALIDYGSGNIQSAYKALELVSNSKKKILVIKKDLSELESIKEKQEENYSLLKQKINRFTHEKIIRESQSIQTRLILKLSSKRLLLERSRNIEVKDIYKN